MSKRRNYYEQLIAPIEDQMMRSVWRIARDPDDAEDAFQEALTKVWNQLEKIVRHPNPQALILRICINAAYDHLRKKARLRRREELQTVIDLMRDPAPSPRRALVSRETEAEIYQAIAQLPPNQAEAITLRTIEGLSYAEIAGALGCSEVTVRTHVSRARAQLSKVLSHLVGNSREEARQ